MKGEGYFLNDDRASGGKKTEDGFIVCGHGFCQKGLRLQEWRQRGGMCMVCMKPLCQSCYNRTRQFGCEPTEQAMERALTAAHRRQQNAKLMGI